MKDFRVLIGSAGWLFPQWQGTFYPEDMPQEWQLGYYGNVYRVVLVKAHQWPTSITEAQTWLQESADSPVFVLDWPAQWRQPAQLEFARSVIDALGSRVLGIVIKVSVLQTMEDTAVLQDLFERYRICLDEDVEPVQRDAHIAATWLNDVRLGRCWHGAGTGSELQQGQLALAWIDTRDMTLKRIRSVLEAVLAAQDPQRYLAVIFDGDPPALNVLQQAMTMIDML